MRAATCDGLHLTSCRRGSMHRFAEPFESLAGAPGPGESLHGPMPSHDGSARGRLLTESSTRAFAALRARATGSLARIRAIAAAAFCGIAAVYTIAGGADLHMNFWPLLLDALAGWAVYRWGGRGGWRERVSTL